MSPASPAYETLVWTGPARAATVEAVLARLEPDVRCAGIAGPRCAELERLGQTLSCPVLDDLRQLCIDRPAPFLLLAEPPDHPILDALALAPRGCTLLSLEPLFADLSDLFAARRQIEHDRPAPDAAAAASPAPRHLPRFLDSPGFLAATDPDQALGPKPALAFLSTAPAHDASLFSQLLDAWRSTLRFAFLPELVDACFIAPEDAPPHDHLRRLTGRLTAHARGDLGSITLLVTDHAARWRRRLDALADAVELAVTDEGYELHGNRGLVVEREPQRAAALTYADAVAHGWRRALARPATPDRWAWDREAEALACCQACLLSARTGQPESPRRMLEMGR